MPATLPRTLYFYLAIGLGQGLLLWWAQIPGLFEQSLASLAWALVVLALVGGLGLQLLAGQARMRGAQLLAGQGKLDEARKLLSEANAVSAEQSLQLAIAEAALLRKANQPQAALDLLDALLEKQPDNPELLYETALLAERLDQMEIMERRLRRLIELQPENGQAYNALGYSFADRGIQLTEARELIEKALALMPNDTFILDSLGWVLYRQGDLPGGLAALERAYGMRDDPEIAAHLGEVLWFMNRKDEAQKLLRAAQKKHPDNEPLADAVKKFAD